LLHRYYVEPPCIVIRGKPSAALADRLEKDEKARLAKQVEELGPDGLEKATKLLEEAKEEHARPIPEDILTSFPVPDVKSISWIPVRSVQEKGKGRVPIAVGATPADDLKKHIEADGEELPFFVQFDDVKVTCAAYSLGRASALTSYLVGFHHNPCFVFPGKSSRPFPSVSDQVLNPCRGVDVGSILDTCPPSKLLCSPYLSTENPESIYRTRRSSTS
jgi:hypothetical protein